MTNSTIENKKIPKLELLENDTYGERVDKVNAFWAEMDKFRYGLILELINNILKLSKEVAYTNLYSVNINKMVVLKNSDHNIEVLSKYKKNIKKHFNINLELDEPKNDYIFTVLRKMLNKIGYKLVPRKINKIDTYRIKK